MLHYDCINIGILKLRYPSYWAVSLDSDFHKILQMSSTAHYDFIKLCASAHKSVSKALAFDQGNSYLNGQSDLQSAIALYQHGVACINSVLEYEQILPNETAKFESLRNTLDRIQERLAVLTKSHSERNELNENATKRKPATAAAPRKKYSKEQQELAHQILDEILIEKPMIQWKDVVGLDRAKTALYEIVILPYLRPELFTGLRTPGKCF